MIHETAEQLQLSSSELFFLSFATLFFSIGLSFVIVLYSSRIIKTHRKRRRIKLRRQIQDVLNKILINETYSERPPGGTAALGFYMSELRHLTRSSAFARNVLISLLLDIKKNITGNSADAIIAIYNTGELYNTSLRKLKNRAWHKKALGIRELAEMRYHPAVPVIAHYLYSSNRTLRRESFMALVRLEDRPLRFLHSYRHDITPWERLNMYHYLSALDPRKLPLFSELFHHKNETIVLFALSMARQFRQTASLPGIVDLLHERNPTVVGLAVTAIGDLEAYQYRNQVARLALHVWNFEKLAIRALRCLGKIGDMLNDVELVGKFLAHPLHSVRFEAVSTLKKLGSRGYEFLQSYNEGNRIAVVNLVHHLSEPLLE